jgi:hypothetical protein
LNQLSKLENPKSRKNLKINSLITKRWLWAIVSALLLAQAVQSLYIVHRASLTFDEGNHSFASYMMWKTGDYGSESRTSTSGKAAGHGTSITDEALDPSAAGARLQDRSLPQWPRLARSQ